MAIERLDLVNALGETSQEGGKIRERYRVAVPGDPRGKRIEGLDEGGALWRRIVESRVISLQDAESKVRSRLDGQRKAGVTLTKDSACLAEVVTISSREES
jgi:hypothetical protein